MTSAFRTCDIRGIYPSEINESFFAELGRLIAKTYANGRSVLVGSDVRQSSSALKSALIRGLASAGANVLDGGCIPTPLLYFGHRKFGCAVSCSVTASHNAPHFNGLKLLIGRGAALPAQIDDLRLAAAKADGPAGGSGSVASIDVVSCYRSSMLEQWHNIFVDTARKYMRRPIVIDPGGGAWSGLALSILRDLDIECSAINDDPDPVFSERSPDCARPGELKALGAEVRSMGAAAGFAWDGDGDRLAVCDENGARLLPDQVAMLLLDRIATKLGDRILADIKMSFRVREAIQKLGCVPIIEKSAHCLLEHAMIRENCRFGCELSGHYFWRELHGADDGLYSTLQFLSSVLSERESLSRLVRSLPDVFLTPDLRFSGSSEEFLEIAARLRAHFPARAIRELDGIKVELPTAWFLIRQSVSESKLSCRFEGNTEEDLRSIIEEVLDSLGEVRNPLASALGGWANEPQINH